MEIVFVLQKVDSSITIVWIVKKIVHFVQHSMMKNIAKFARMVYLRLRENAWSVNS